MIFSTGLGKGFLLSYNKYDSSIIICVRVCASMRIFCAEHASIIMIDEIKGDGSGMLCVLRSVCNVITSCKYPKHFIQIRMGFRSARLSERRMKW